VQETVRAAGTCTSDVVFVREADDFFSTFVFFFSRSRAHGSQLGTRKQRDEVAFVDIRGQKKGNIQSKKDVEDGVSSSPFTPSTTTVPLDFFGMKFLLPAAAFLP